MPVLNVVHCQVQVYVTGRFLVSKPVLIWSLLRNLAPQTVCSVPEAATTVLRTHDDGRDGRPKHVE